jgi:hypothetical protein
MQAVSGRRLMMTVVLLSLAAAGAARAAAQTARFGGVSAKLSYLEGSGPGTRNLRIGITQAATNQHYNQPIASSYCFKRDRCSPASRRAVHVAYLEGNGAIEVIVDLFSGGADCCFIEQVFTPSAALGNTYFVTQRNFGPAGATLTDLGHRGHLDFVSANRAFYCQFTACYASGMPIQIFGFNGLSFTDITRHYPQAIARDASRWWITYRHHERTGAGALAAWAADEDLLGHSASAAGTLAREVASGHVTAGYVAQLQAFLKRHGYTR